MAEKTFWETTKVQGDRLLETVKKLVHEGNVRRIIIKQGDRSVAEFPMTAGVVGAVFAPVLAAIGALAALITECTIAVEREVPAGAASDEAAPGAPQTEAEAPQPPPDGTDGGGAAL
jgi:hypothetical protein